jgi:asparagine synthase (glutamine-hydrolysing)
MCGIFIAINRESHFTRNDFDRFMAMTDLVRYRGPDASGYLALNLKDGTTGDRDHFDVFLGHRRLAIIDLSAGGNQPLQGMRRTWLTFNGEIYNYRELREEFRNDWAFRTQTDSEVILAAYETHGPDAFSKFNGEWAFAIADMDARRVVISRDRFSIKPVYEYIADGCYFYGSEVKQLIPLMRCVRLQKETMFLYLNQGLLDSNDRTFISGVRQLKAKHNVVVPLGSGLVEEKQYWNYSISGGPSDLCEVIEEFRSLMTDSVRLRLRSDVTVGALLSGGLDSSTLALLANQINPAGVATYSVVSQNPAFSEARFVDALTRHCNIRNRKVLLNEADIVGAMADVIKHNDGPPQAFTALAHYTMMGLIKKETDITVVLTGQGGDEILLGYRKFFFFLLRNLVRQQAYASAARQLAGSMWSRTAVWQLNLGEASRYRKRKALMARPYLCGRQETAPIFECHDMAARQQSDIDQYSVPNLTHYEDRNAMAFSLETRLPFLDHRLVNFALSIRPEYKIRNGWSKYVLRAAFPELPHSIRWRPDKQGFTIPEKQWLQSEFKELIQTMFQDSLLEKFDILNGRAFIQYYDEFRTGKRSIWHTDISRALMAEIWTRSIFGGKAEIERDLTSAASAMQTVR